MTVTIPRGVIDGQKASFPIKIGSGFALMFPNPRKSDSPFPLRC
ncbi:hypothetical protein [Geotalea toluenoxydans]